ncbi:MAG: phospho-N-acetylmuramoyl-pentapeptide-transferase, partial [Clostridia bacterium]|nr:phospho-N-acetylmuramoyl-pentapeptide-transferase [Clostridia bacterium]
CSQTILKYVEEHKSKQGTPTMGGIVFFLTTFLLIFIFLDYETNWFLCLMVGFSFALIGGMDDFIKIKFKRNLGLLPYQKIVGQLGISLILALYIYYQVGTSLSIPFFNNQINVGWFIIPVVITTCLATTNAVNLTDGLDGLAGSVSVVVLAITMVILGFMQAGSGATINNLSNLIVLIAIFMASILGFLVYNTNKASIFMGDVGSLGIGGFISAIFCVCGLELSLLFLGIMFVASTLSVIIQVFSFKVFHRRVFKMSPLHHHFQQMGFSEAKITYAYSIITGLMGLLLILSYV